MPEDPKKNAPWKESTRVPRTPERTNFDVSLEEALKDSEKKDSEEERREN